MEAPTVPIPSRQPLPRLLAALLAGTVLLIALIVYAGGFANLRDENAFSERRVSFVCQDEHLSQVLAKLFSDQDVRFVESSDLDVIYSWTITDLPEREVVRQLAEVSELRIRRVGDEVVVAKPSWTWKRYDAWDLWFREHCGFSPWGRPPQTFTRRAK